MPSDRPTIFALEMPALRMAAMRSAFAIGLDRNQSASARSAEGVRLSCLRDKNADDEVLGTGKPL